MTSEDMLTLMRTRYTTKHYDPARKISDKDWETVLEIMRLSPSSCNAQPWQVFVVDTEGAKEKIMPAIKDFNLTRVKACDRLVIFAAPLNVSPDYLEELYRQEEADGRYQSMPPGMVPDAIRQEAVKQYSNDPAGLYNWASNQVNIMIGVVTLASAAMGIDSTIVGGFDHDKMDAILGLKEKGLKSVCAMCFGYRAANDGNATRPKSRLARERIIHRVL